MKKSAWFIVITALIMTACSSQKRATSYLDDDVYNDTPSGKQTLTTTAPSAAAPVVTAPDKASAQQKPASAVTDNDYSDYSYSSRINRFNNRDTTKGYFDESFSEGSGAGGSQDNSPDVNFYFGTGYGSFWSPSLYIGAGWGYPWYDWGYPGFGWGYPYYRYYGYGYPWYGWGHSWYDPWYNPWYCCYGYYDYYPYYADSYYGSRRTLFSSDGTGRSGISRNTSGTGYLTSERNVRTDGTPSPRTITSNERSRPTADGNYRYTRPATGREPGIQRTTTRQYAQDIDRSTRQQPAPRYTRPGVNDPSGRTGTSQSYTPPAYRQPKTSQEYLAPRTQNPGAGRRQSDGGIQRTDPGSTGTRTITPPSGTGRTYESPSRSGSPSYTPPARVAPGNNQGTPRSGGGTYTAPSRSSGTYSQPSRSRSEGSYSAPSRSSGSGTYSAPSRSGGNNSAPSGNSGGGRRR